MPQLNDTNSGQQTLDPFTRDWLKCLDWGLTSTTNSLVAFARLWSSHLFQLSYGILSPCHSRCSVGHLLSSIPLELSWAWVRRNRSLPGSSCRNTSVISYDYTTCHRINQTSPHAVTNSKLSWTKASDSGLHALGRVLGPQSLCSMGSLPRWWTPDHYDYQCIVLYGWVCRRKRCILCSGPRNFVVVVFATD